jgi:hypothetical protein
VKLIALLLAFAGMQQDETIDLSVPGTFQHGAWQGRCFRDGFLSGMDHELCRGWTQGPVAIHFERTAEAVRFSVTVKGCPRYSGREVTVKSDDLTRPRRAGENAEMLGRIVPIVLSACRSKYAAPVVDVAALAAVLTETDGLEAGSMK